MGFRDCRGREPATYAGNIVGCHDQDLELPRAKFDEHSLVVCHTDCVGRAAVGCDRRRVCLEHRIVYPTGADQSRVVICDAWCKQRASSECNVVVGPAKDRGVSVVQPFDLGMVFRESRLAGHSFDACNCCAVDPPHVLVQFARSFKHGLGFRHPVVRGRAVDGCDCRLCFEKDRLVHSAALDQHRMGFRRVVRLERTSDGCDFRRGYAED
mmetsp:Transcript_114553/g.370303  ORF Transcript_114553/g.370303 Transcript_114553/m.370303 type:complete len:211 (+) Transcript_114553:974-1606(+)